MSGYIISCYKQCQTYFKFMISQHRRDQRHLHRKIWLFVGGLALSHLHIYTAIRVVSRARLYIPLKNHLGTRLLSGYVATIASGYDDFLYMD